MSETSGEDEFKDRMKAKLQELKDSGIVDVEENTGRVIITGDHLVFGEAKAQDESHRALCFHILSQETPFSMFHLVSDKQQLRRIREAINDILSESGGTEIV